MPLPTRRLLLLLAGASALFALSTPTALLVDAALVALAAVDLAAVAGARAVRVGRRAPARVPRGGSAEIALRLSNPGSGPRTVRVIDDLSPALEREGPEVREVEVPARGVGVVTRSVRAVGRGDAALGDIHLRVRGPLGLVWRDATEPARQTVRIQPGVLEMRRHRLLGIRHRLRSTGLRNTRQRGEGRAFESLRQYARGDDPRAIDWKATARRRALLVRQHQAERSQNVILAVDAGRRMLEDLGDAIRLDHALAAALVLADVAGVHGDRVGLLAFADTVQQFLPPRRTSLPRVADVLSGVRPRPVEPNYPLAFAFLARHVRRRSLIVLFTDVVDPGASSAVLTELGRAAGRHVVMAVALRNPALARRADAPVADEGGAYRRAAAEELLQARSLALATVRRKGVLIADASPGEAVPEVINRYLEVKYRGRL